MAKEYLGPKGLAEIIRLTKEAANEAAQKANADQVVFVDGQNLQGKFDSGVFGDLHGVAFTITLKSNGWSGGYQTVSDSRFLSDDKYNYIVEPSSPKENMAAYYSSNVHAESIPANGSMRFWCDDVPTSNLTASILRLEVPNG